jgi:hypothetical protein
MSEEQKLIDALREIPTRMLDDREIRRIVDREKQAA